MKNFTNNFKQFTSRLSARWLIMALMLLLGTSSAWAWGWVARCVDLQSSENPTYYLGDEATFYWCFNGDGSNATFKRACISTSSSSAGTWMDNLKWVKDGCDGNNNKTWKASFLLSSTGTKYYGLWLGWGKSVGDNGRYYNGSSSWSEGSDKFSSSKFTVNELPNPTDQTNSLSGTTATLTWTKNTTYTTVLVVRYAKGAAETKPTGGTSYSANNTIGNGTVVYKGTAGSCTNTITAGNSYDYYFYTVNNNYYSSGVKTTLEGCAKPSAPTIKINGGSSAKLCSGTATITVEYYNSANTYTLYKGDAAVQNPTFDNGEFTVSEADTYSVTVTTCAKSDPSTGVTLEYYSAPTIEIDTYSVVNEKSCNGNPQGNGKIEVVEKVGENYSLDGVEGTSWSNLSAGTYTLKATLSTCPSLDDTEEITVGTTDITAFTEDVKISTTNDNVCAGSEITLTATPISDATYTWYAAGNVINGANQNTLTVTVSEETTYKVVVSKTNQGCETIKEKSKTITVTENPTISSINIDRNAICSGESSTITVEGNALNFQLYTKNGDTYTPFGEKQETKTFTVNATNTYVVKAFNGKCESMSDEVTLTVKPKPTISLNPTSNSVCSGTTIGDIETYVAITKTEGSEVNWYASAQGGDALASSTALNATSYFAEATLNGCSSDRAVFAITDVLSAPTEIPNVTAPESICDGESAVLKLNNKNANYTYKVNGEVVVFTNDEYTVSPTSTTDYTVSVENKCGSLSTTKTITVNPLPTINIGEDVTAVKFEDVKLTATGNNIDDVTWTVNKGTITKDATDPKKAVLTYDQTGTVTVTATATSAAGCTSTVATKTVTFDEEDCSDDVKYDNEHVEIWLSSTLDKTMYLHRWYENGDNDSNITTWPGASTTKSDGYYKWVTTSSGKIGYIFHDYTASNKSSDASKTLEKGYRYYFTFNGGTGSATFNKSERITTTTPKPISAPAVKTVSVNSEQGSGVVNFVGKVIKTGCAAGTKIYVGYQYKLATEPWPNNVTAGNAKGNLIAVPDADGKTLYETYSATISGLPDENYVFRAYIINGYNFTNGNYNQGVYYGIDIPVTVSTVKDPVSTATIQLTESDGTPVANDKKYCVGETGYIKVESDVKYTEISWKSQQGVNIVQTRLMNMYQFVVKGNDNIVVLLSNKYNVTPAESNTIEIYTFADPVLPTVSLNKVSICSNDAVGATVKLTNVVKGQTYQLYQQIDNGDETFTEQAIGDAKTQTEEVTDKTELVLHTLTKTAATGKYFVKTYTEQCTKNMAATQPFTFTVVDADKVFIILDPISAETTPWMPAKFTVRASDAYTLNVTKGNPAEAATEAEVSQNGNNVSVKIPLPQGSTLPEGTTGVYGQYENVVFPQDATTQYTITATLSATGGDDNPCAAPANATITLIPYVEECTIGH